MHETGVITAEQSSLHSDTNKKKNKGSSSYKRDVKVVRSLLRMFPMWGTFFVVSLASAAGNTFYIEQYNNLKNEHNIPIQIYDLIQDFSGFLIPFVYHWTCFFGNQKFKIGVGMFCSIVSCMCAWRLEVHRLKCLSMLGGDEDAETSLSFLWLVPQFCMLGCMEGLTQNGLLNFFKSQIDEPMKQYGDEYMQVVICLGKLINIVLILILKRQFGWFGENVNNGTRLDKYYLLLVGVCSVNLIIYCCIVKCFYKDKDGNLPHEELRQLDHTSTTIWKKVREIVLTSF
nr:putative proton-dependent oligopeptide transporter family [Tanacetum cinerariifolium]